MTKREIDKLPPIFKHCCGYTRSTWDTNDPFVDRNGWVCATNGVICVRMLKRAAKPKKAAAARHPNVGKCPHWKAKRGPALAVHMQMISPSDEGISCAVMPMKLGGGWCNRRYIQFLWRHGINVVHKCAPTKDPAYGKWYAYYFRGDGFEGLLTQVTPPKDNK